MDRQRLVNMRVFALAVLALATPVVLIFGLLVEFDFIAALPGILGALAIALATGYVAYRHLSRIEEARRYIDLLARGQAPAPPDDEEDPSDLVAAVVRLSATWSERANRLEELVATNRAVSDAVPFPMLRLTEKRRVIRTNRAAERLLGAGLEGHDISAVIRHPGMTQAVAALKPDEPAEIRFYLPHPIDRSFVAHVVPLERVLSDGTATVITLHDITELKRAEDMRADFVANASHELRTPLTSFAGYLETLAGPARDDPKARDKFIQIMRQQASRMVRLVDDLLSLSKIELTERERPAGKVRIDAVIRTVVEFLQPEAAGRGMTITVDVAKTADGKSPAVIGDGDQLAQVFQNLVDNAIKYGRPGTPVEITVRYIDDPPHQVDVFDSPPAFKAVAVTVADRGAGIAPAHLPRLTERFYRVDQARSRAMGGTGLGLAIVKHILQRHGGVLGIESREGEGSRFTAYLPGAAPL